MKEYNVIHVNVEYAYCRYQFHAQIRFSGAWDEDYLYEGYGDTLELALADLSKQLGTPQEFRYNVWGVSNQDE